MSKVDLLQTQWQKQLEYGEKKYQGEEDFIRCQVIGSVWGQGLILYGFHWPELLQADPKNLQVGVHTGSDPLAIRGPIQTILEHMGFA